MGARFHWSTGLVHGYMNFMKFSMNLFIQVFNESFWVVLFINSKIDWWKNVQFSPIQTTSLVPKRSRLGQSWTLPWAVTSPRDTRQTSREQRGKRERLGTRGWQTTNAKLNTADKSYTKENDERRVEKLQGSLKPTTILIAYRWRKVR